MRPGRQREPMGAGGAGPPPAVPSCGEARPPSERKARVQQRAATRCAPTPHRHARRWQAYRKFAAGVAPTTANRHDRPTPGVAGVIGTGHSGRCARKLLCSNAFSAHESRWCAGGLARSRIAKATPLQRSSPSQSWELSLPAARRKRPGVASKGEGCPPGVVSKFAVAIPAGQRNLHDAQLSPLTVARIR